jgi:uncharacterized coiled-coil protein SlyX
MATDSPSRFDSQWHLDKRVNVAMIVGAVAHLCAFVWMVSAMNTRLDTVEAKLSAQTSSVERLAILEAKMVGVDRSVARIEVQMDRIEAKLDKSIEARAK